MISHLPAVNATLNAISAVLLTCGYVMIRQRRIETHRRFMLSAFATSALFLTSYLVYHYNIGSKPFPGQGPIRVVYFAILITPRDSRGRGAAAGTHHAEPRSPIAIREARAHRALDVADLALRLGDGCGGVSDVVLVRPT